nr:MAG TPA: HeH/LEM domain [Caudoviricetes sp.]
MTKVQLLSYAKGSGISGVSAAMTKAEIVAAIKAGGRRNE